MKVTISPQEMTLGEMEEFEAASGSGIDGLYQLIDGREKVSLSEVPLKMITALVWIFAKRDDPGLTMDQVRATRMVDLEFGDPPAEAGAVASAATSRRSAASTTSRRKTSGR